MMPPRDALYLRHMLDALQRIGQYAAGTTRHAFGSDRLLQDGIVRQLTVLGEAAGKVSPAFAQAHTEIPWPDVTGIRHKLVHDYFVVDIDVVWVTATQDAPALLPLIAAALADLDR
jgi:uncharacterized protein with HEPN domain